VTVLLRRLPPPHTWYGREIQRGDIIRARNRYGLMVTITVRTWSGPDAPDPFITGWSDRGMRSIYLRNVTRLVKGEGA
jgi:hypothetical protein